MPLPLFMRSYTVLTRTHIRRLCTLLLLLLLQVKGLQVLDGGAQVLAGGIEVKDGGGIFVNSDDTEPALLAIATSPTYQGATLLVSKSACMLQRKCALCEC
jgi:hypothetical protein